MYQHNSRCGMPAALEMKVPSKGCAEVRAVRASAEKSLPFEVGRILPSRIVSLLYTWRRLGEKTMSYRVSACRNDEQLGKEKVGRCVNG